MKMKKSESHGIGDTVTSVRGVHLYAKPVLSQENAYETNTYKCSLPTNYSQPTLSYRMMNWYSVVSVE